MRELGTQGGGDGIESVSKNSDRYFYPHITCPHCNTIQALDPKGCLLRPITIRDALGRTKQSYFSPSNRPVKWFHKDPLDMIGSAYIGCQNCEEEIPQEIRTNARMRCIKTGEYLTDFLDALPPGIPKKRWKATGHFSPLTRDVGYNIGAEIIQSGLDAFSPIDWIQQMLGHSSSSEKTNITEELLRAAIAAPKPLGNPTYTIAGIDMGRSEDWMTINAYYLPAGYERMLPSQVSDQTIRVSLLSTSVDRANIPKLLLDYKCDYGMIDNEPSRDTAMTLAENTCLDLGDQIYRPIDNNVRSSIVSDGGRKAECWTLDTNYFADAILNAFLLEAADGFILKRLGEEWDAHIANKTALSPAKHITAPYRATEGGWVKPSDGIDHLFMAEVFAETAFYTLINGLRDPKRAKPPSVYESYSYALHNFSIAESEGFPYVQTMPLFVSFNFYAVTAIAIQQGKDGYFVRNEWQADTVESLTVQVNDWVRSIGHRSRTFVYGSVDDTVPSWKEFWIVARSIGMKATQRYTPKPVSIVDSVSRCNRSFKEGEIFIYPSCPRLSRDLERGTVWQGLGSIGGTFEFSECLRYFVAQHT